jgi:hypothetical protein
MNRRHVLVTQPAEELAMAIRNTIVLLFLLFVVVDSVLDMCNTVVDCCARCAPTVLKQARTINVPTDNHLC